LPGRGVRIPARQGHETLHALWQREMPLATYDPRWLQCSTPRARCPGLHPVAAQPQPLRHAAPEQYQRIFAESAGIYGTTRDYALATYDGLQAMGIRDRALEQVLHWGKAWEDRQPRPRSSPAQGTSPGGAERPRLSHGGPQHRGGGTCHLDAHQTPGHPIGQRPACGR
jgi:cation transport protein ChaC